MRNYPDTIYCIGCDEEKPLAEFKRNKDGTFRALLCHTHLKELGRAFRNDDYDVIERLSNRNFNCLTCGVPIKSSRAKFRANGYKKLTDCNKCLLRKSFVSIPIDFYDWANKNPIQLLPQETIPQAKDSEYHRNYERTDTNPSFFKHLCSGSSFEFQ